MTASIETGMIVEKKVFELERFTTANGADLKSVRIGWESYGELNADASNATVTIPISFAVGGGAIAGNLPYTYNATQGKSGKAKAP